MSVITLTTQDGQKVQYVDEMIGQGGMKDVYFSPKRDYVVAFFRGQPDVALLDRLTTISDTYRKRIFE